MSSISLPGSDAIRIIESKYRNALTKHQLNVPLLIDSTDVINLFVKAYRSVIQISCVECQLGMLITKIPKASAIEPAQREQAILPLLTRGMSNREFGKRLHRSPFKVRHHVSQLIRKSGASNRAEVAAFAVERGLIV